MFPAAVDRVVAHDDLGGLGAGRGEGAVQPGQLLADRVAAVDRRVGEASRARGSPPVPAVDGEGRRMPVLLPRTGPVAGPPGAAPTGARPRRQLIAAAPLAAALK